MRIRRIWLGVVAALLLTGCAGTHFKWEDTQRVQPGMTEAEVVEILGPPYMRTQQGNTTILTWSYANSFTGARAVSYRFVDGRIDTSTTLGQ